MSTTLVITARFLLGTFLGHRDVGLVADYPDTARLHAALLHSAGKGTKAVERDGRLRPSPESLAALRWLEEHAPVGLTRPGHRRVASFPARSWRVEGTVTRTQGSVASPKRLKSQSDAVAVDGPFSWGWNAPPANVVETITALCQDVSCLGESDSPAILAAELRDDWVPTHVLDPEQSGFPQPGGVAIRTPVHGRVDALERAYDEAYPSRPPSIAKDRHRFSEHPRPSLPAIEGVRELTYRVLSAEPVDVPWAWIVLLRIESEVDTRLSVPLCVALHRAIAARVGDDAPGMITGRFPKGAVRPANRIALQALPVSPMASSLREQPSFALLIPSGIGAVDLARLQAAVKGLRKIYGRFGAVEVAGGIEMIDGAAFWAPVPNGFVRRWRPLPALVPEVRRQRGPSVGAWSLEDAGALSAAYVFRDSLDVDFTGRDRYLRAVQAVRARGFRIDDVHLVRDSRMERYAHKTPDGVAVQPYTGWVDLGGLAPERALIALGQSRHLGGGLLFPQDVPVPIAEASEKER